MSVLYHFFAFRRTLIEPDVAENSGKTDMRYSHLLLASCSKKDCLSNKHAATASTAVLSDFVVSQREGDRFQELERRQIRESKNKAELPKG